MGGGEAGEVVKRGGEVVRGNQYLSITLITNYSNYQLINRLFITRRQVVQVVKERKSEREIESEREIPSMVGTCLRAILNFVHIIPPTCLVSLKGSLLSFCRLLIMSGLGHIKPLSSTSS